MSMMIPGAGVIYLELIDSNADTGEGAFFEAGYQLISLKYKNLFLKDKYKIYRINIDVTGGGSF